MFLPHFASPILLFAATAVKRTFRVILLIERHLAHEASGVAEGEEAYIEGKGWDGSENRL